tara:strand:+ start:625 stop:900 length:276 start_codon:yes stop_codon:yes gene_type:complete
VLKVNEIYSITQRTTQGVRKVYALRECLLNKRYIVAIYPHKFKSSSDHQMMGDLLEKDRVFSRIILDGNSFRSSEMVVNEPYDSLVKELFQ